MKKIKIMLSAVAVIAVVGGALAFKVKNSQPYCFYAGPSNGAQSTAVTKYLTSDFITTIAEGSGDWNRIVPLGSPALDCPATTTVTTQLTTVEE